MASFRNTTSTMKRNLSIARQQSRVDDGSIGLPRGSFYNRSLSWSPPLDDDGCGSSLCPNDDEDTSKQRRRRSSSSSSSSSSANVQKHLDLWRLRLLWWIRSHPRRRLLLLLTSLVVLQQHIFTTRTHTRRHTSNDQDSMRVLLQVKHTGSGNAVDDWWTPSNTAEDTLAPTEISDFDLGNDDYYIRQQHEQDKGVKNSFEVFPFSSLYEPELLIKKKIYLEALKQERREMKRLGITLPKQGVNLDPAVPFHPVEIHTFAAHKELLMRREERGMFLAAMEEVGDEEECNTMPGNCIIPNAIFIPDMIHWYPPRPGKLDSYQRLLFTEHGMREAVEDTMPSLLPAYDSIPPGINNSLDRIQLWAICAIYRFGGVFVGDRLQTNQTFTDELLYSWSSVISSSFLPNPTAIAVVDSSSQSISMLISTPRHPLLHCALLQLEDLALFKQRLDSRAIISSLLLTLTSEDFSSSDDSWKRLSTRSILDENACNMFIDESLDSAPKEKDLIEHDVRDASIYMTMTKEEEAPEAQLQQEAPGNVRVSIQEEEQHVDEKHIDEEHAMVLDKVSVSSLIEELDVKPSFRCKRCLWSPVHGTMEQCSRYCAPEYIALMCNDSSIHEGKVSRHINVWVEGGQVANVINRDTGKTSTPTMIPRIIHQTWFEEIDFDHYPDLARLQMSWKNTGWDYRLYTDVTARQYIAQHFPPKFVQAFDALIHGAYKADLFRYLVLLREGGVYADVDVLLETTLDNFIVPSLSFFAPRDVVGEYANEPFTLWNGFLGAAPGHPILVRAIEWSVNMIINRADQLDMERELCHRQRSNNVTKVMDPSEEQQQTPLEIWKIRSEPSLFLTGPCALGIAYNQALGQSSPVQAIELGWTGMDALKYDGKQERDYGDALILVVDKGDYGSMRFSDPERNTIVASTELEGVQKNARTPSNPTQSDLRRLAKRDEYKKRHAHYSEAAVGTEIWGRSGIYIDNAISNEWIMMDVQYTDEISSSTADANGTKTEDEEVVYFEEDEENHEIHKIKKEPIMAQ